MKLLMIILLLSINACGPTVIMLKNNKTNEIVKCAGDPWGSPAKEAKICAQAYEKNGYKRIDVDN
jgi:hypothetical protein